MSVSRSLKGIVHEYSSRPNDWFHAKGCATQYGKLLESVETPKRKKVNENLLQLTQFKRLILQRTASERDQPAETPSTPVESLVKKLTEERVVELKKLIHEEQQQFAKLKEEILFLSSSSMDEARIREMWLELEQEKVQKEIDQTRHDQWLKERDEKKLELERQWRTQKAPLKIQKSISQEEPTEPDTTTQTHSVQSGSAPSPLLTSLLKSPSQANQAQQPSIVSNSARVAPTITNLLTSSTANVILQSSTQNILINASQSSPSFAPSNIINSPASSSSSSTNIVSSAPTLINLLDKKFAQDVSINEKQQLIMSMSVVPIESGGKDGDIVKDEEAELLADFNELIDAEKFDIDEDLEDLNSIIMNPEILEEKISDSEHNKDVDDSSQATSTDDYEKLKIKQIVETIQDFAGVDIDAIGSTSSSSASQALTSSINMDLISNANEINNSAPTSVEMMMIEAPMEASNDSTIKEELPPAGQEEKIVMISDESSNTNDLDFKIKEELSDKICEMFTNDGEESQSAKSSAADEIKQEEKEIPVVESDENSMASEKERKESINFQIDDSEDAIFEDAKEKLDDLDQNPVKDEPSEKQPEIHGPKLSKENEEASRSAIDSEDEVLQKSSRSTSRKKALDSLKADTPSSSTRSRDHSENDDNRDTTPIRTRSRHSSTAISEPKSSFSFSKEQDHSMWKARWDDCSKELQRHKDFSQVIDNKTMQDDFYKKVCLQPMNMKIIAKNIENHISTLPNDIKRDFALMCTNFVMLNSKGTKFNEIIHQFTKDCLEIIESHMEIEDAYKSYRKQIKKKNN